MAKNKGSNNRTKNVFKVAGSRTLRIKSKAQKVSLNLKNLDNVKNPNKNKTNLINQQLAELRKEVYQAKDSKKSEKMMKKKIVQTNKKSTKMETESTASLVKDMKI